jgi:hypothetical protein
MPGLVPGIHVFALLKPRKTWMAGTSPAMTKMRVIFSPTLRPAIVLFAISDGIMMLAFPL